jgi:rhamnogalacturonan endolyase
MTRSLTLLLAVAAFFQPGGAIPLGAAETGSPVTVREDADTATLDNGIVFAQVKKSNGNLLSLRFHGTELLSHGGAYWNLYGAIPGQPSTQEKGAPSTFRVTQDPAANRGERGEITLRFPYLGQPKTVPMDIEIRYTLHRGDTGLYGWTIADHQPQYPAFNVEVSTVCLKLNPQVFDFLSIDEKRQRPMATSEDWVKGTQLNLWEARRLNTGIRKGEVEHKYDYSFVFAQTPAWGWSSTRKKVGLYIVNPSTEYLNGAATEVDYGGHIDVKAALPADPTLLFIWHSPHYGGRGIEIKAGEAWHKVVGPFLIYCAAGATPEAMWRDALARAAQDQKRWPYAWADGPGYEHAAGRGEATGRLAIKDPQAPAASIDGAWVGLAQPPYTASFKKSGPTTIDWQTDGKHYEYWGRADRDGHFTIRNARPGDYTLYAFNDGVLGDFSRANVQIEAGKTTDLGDLTWVPVRHGRQLWEIGVPNRSAEEFRHGDHYWQWGLYNLYAQEFPHDVDFVVGTSDWRKDWNYVQPPHLDGKNGTDCSWKIRFQVAEAAAGTATLRLAICGARGGPVDVSVNGKTVGSTGPLPESGVMHRDGIRSAALVYSDIPFDAALLKPGENVITLTKRAKAWTDGVLYDYIRLELADAR